jgi:hypothetical protein
MAESITQASFAATVAICEALGLDPTTTKGVEISIAAPGRIEVRICQVLRDETARGLIEQIKRCELVPAEIAEYHRDLERRAVEAEHQRNGTKEE